MDPENPTTDSATSTAQEPATPAAAPAAQEPSTPAPKLLSLTQEQYNAAMAAARRDGKEQGKKEAKASPSQPQAAPAQPAATNADADRPVTRAELDAMKRENKFATTLVEKGLKLTELQRNALLPHFSIGDPDSILGVAHEMFPHLNAPAPAAPAQPAMPAVPTPAKPPGQGGAAPATAPAYVSPGAPQGSPDAGMDTDPRLYSKDQVKAYELDGTLMARVESWKARQPGGGGQGLFPNRANVKR